MRSATVAISALDSPPAGESPRVLGTLLLPHGRLQGVLHRPRPPGGRLRAHPHQAQSKGMEYAERSRLC
eukprot:4929326-Heterocapsa_arctica.AAC.1